MAKLSAIVPPAVAPLISSCSEEPSRISDDVIPTLTLATVAPESRSAIWALVSVPSFRSLLVVSAPLSSVKVPEVVARASVGVSLNPVIFTV